MRAIQSTKKMKYNPTVGVKRNRVIVPMWMFTVGTMTGIMTSVVATTYKLGEREKVTPIEVVMWFLLGGAVGGSTLGYYLGRVNLSHV